MDPMTRFLVVLMVVMCLLFLCTSVYYLWRVQQLQEKHAQEKKHLQEFFLMGLGVIAHDLKNFISPLITALSMPVGASDDTWGRLEQQADNLGVVLDSLVEGSKEMLSDTREARPKNLKHLIGEVFDRIELNFSRSAKIIFEDCIQQRINIDYGRLLLVVRNILGNCFKYQHPDRVLEIAVRLEQERELIRIVIRDNGIGIPEEEISRVIRGFHQVQESSAKGSGYGWYMISRLAVKMEGRVELRSQHGEWTEVILEFPEI